MARKIYLRGALSVGAFRRPYGGSKKNGSRPPHFGQNSGFIARHILQELEKMNIVEKDSRGGRKSHPVASAIFSNKNCCGCGIDYLVDLAEMFIQKISV